MILCNVINSKTLQFPKKTDQYSNALNEKVNVNKQHNIV